MRTLILMRHAKAVRAHEAPNDEARGLTDRGRREARQAGEALQAGGFNPALALVSAAKRTRETFEHAGLDVPVRFEKHLYHAGASQLWDAFIGADGEVLLIGHNPGMAELVALLIDQAHDRSSLARDFSGHLPTSAWAAFAIAGDLLHAAGPRFIAGWKPDRD